MIKYQDLLDFNKFEDVYHTIVVNSKHKDKLVLYSMFKTANFSLIFDNLKERNYRHNKYNVFLITEPKSRLIMSESVTDKLVNHLVSKYVLFPLIEPRLISANVATREGKGSKEAIRYVKKYINSYKENFDDIYILKCDIKKFFYSIDHEIVLEKLKTVIEDRDLYNLVKEIVESTDKEYLNREIERVIEREKERIRNLPISKKEKNIKILELDKIPRHSNGKGLPIGNMSSQILAIFYLNDLDHYIKEVLQIKGYIRYMDDLILIHPDKEYLKKCLEKIKIEVQRVRLELNDKTQLYEVKKGFPFLGYYYFLKNKRLIVRICSKTKKRIQKKLGKAKTLEEKKKILNDYNGYLMHADCGAFRYKINKH